MDSFAALIGHWPKPSVSNFASDLGIPVEHAAAMKRRDSVPPGHWERLVAGAERRGIQVTLEVLAGLAASRKSRKAA